MKEHLPEPYVPWWNRMVWSFWIWVTWPIYVRELKKMGFKKVGWMTWEAGPDGSGQGSDTW